MLIIACCLSNTGCGCYRSWVMNRGCNGCGSAYWGDFISYPPDCADPCDGQCGGQCGGAYGRGRSQCSNGLCDTGAGDCREGNCNACRVVGSRTGACPYGYPNVGPRLRPWWTWGCRDCFTCDWCNTGVAWNNWGPYGTSGYVNGGRPHRMRGMAVPGHASMDMMSEGEEIISETTTEDEAAPAAPATAPQAGSSPMARVRRNEPTIAPPRSQMPQQRHDVQPSMPPRSARRVAPNQDPYYASY